MMSAYITNRAKLCIRLPNGKRCTLAAYVHAWRVLLATPERTQVAGFDYWPDDAGRILSQLRQGMHDRINRHIPGHGTGRKWSDDWQRHAIQCTHAVNTPRLRVDWIPPDLRARLAHRISTRDV
jgi:hypothetical protein